MILLQNLFDLLEFCAENNTYIQHTPGATGSQNRFSRFPIESATEQQSNLGFPRMEVVQLPFGIINDYDSAQRDDMSVRVRVIIKLSDKYDYAEQVTAMDNAKRSLMEMVNYILTAQEGYTNDNCLICAFDVNSAKYQFIDRLTYGGNAVGCELSIDFKQYIDWDNIVYGDLPGYPTFCERVDECLDIPTADGQYVLDITDGVKSWAEYSPTGAVVISKTQAQFLDLVGSSNLVFPATYKITDIQNGLFVNTLSANTFSNEASLSFLAPDYTLHAQYHSTDGAIANNAIVTWGGFYWQNTSGGAVTPDLPDELNIDSNPALFTKVSKSIANGYVEIMLSVAITTSLTILSAENSNLTKIIIVPDTNTIDESQFSLGTNASLNKLFTLSNNVLEGDSIISANDGFSSIYRNKLTGGAQITSCGDNSIVYNNQILGAGGINRIYGSLAVTNVVTNLTDNGSFTLDNCSSENSLSYIDGLVATSSNDGLCQIVACTLDGNVQWTNIVLTNTGTGADKISAIFDVRCHENIVINGLEIVSNSIANLQDCVFWINDVVTNLWLKGDNVFFKANESRQCNWDNCKLEHDNSAIQYIHADFSTINYSVTSGASQGYAMEFGEIVDSEIINAVDFNIKNFEFKNINIDFTGWSRDISDEYIKGGKGWFTITHNFATSPLNSGSSVYYNLIPNGARITMLYAIGTLTGTTIEIGLENDDEGLMNEAVGLLPLTWSGVSAAATANRSLKIKAAGGNITAGTLTVKVEFTI